MRVPRLDPRSMLVVGLALLAVGAMVRCGVYQWSWFGDVYAEGFPGLLYLGLSVVEQVLVPLGAAFVGGAFVLAALTPREQDNFPPQY